MSASLHFSAHGINAKAELSKNAPKTSRGFGQSMGVCPRTRTSLGDLLRIRRATQRLSVHGNENSTLASCNLDSRISTDRTWRTVNLQLHYGFATHHYWFRSPRIRNSHTRDGSDFEATVQTAAGSLRRIGLASRGTDYPWILYFDHRQSGDRVGPSAGRYGHLWDGDCGNLHVNEARLSL